MLSAKLASSLSDFCFSDYIFAGKELWFPLVKTLSASGTSLQSRDSTGCKHRWERVFPCAPMAKQRQGERCSYRGTVAFGISDCFSTHRHWLSVSSQSPCEYVRLETALGEWLWPAGCHLPTGLGRDPQELLKKPVQQSLFWHEVEALEGLTRVWFSDFPKALLLNLV